LSSWIVITADPAKIRKVRRRLRRKGYQAYLPAIARVRAVAKGGKLKRRRTITPLMSYILVQAPSEHVLDLWLYDVTSTRDVRGLLQVEDKAALVSDADRAKLANSIEDLIFRLEARAATKRIRAGAKVRLKNGSGPLADRVWTVQWINKARALLEAQLFGSMRVVEVPASALEAA
jgi:transcription antitermination factor NusG